MRKLVVDSSVALKWAVPEIHSEKASRLLEPEFELCAPEWISVEIANALWKKVRRAEITSGEATTILQAFDGAPVELVPSKPLLPNALALALTLNRSVYDSLYLALAVEQKCTFITADQRFHSVVASSELADHVAWIEDELS